jgi:hypothetical protein
VAGWVPGPDLAIDDRQDGEAINSDAIVTGKIDSGLRALKVAAPVKVTVACPLRAARERALRAGAFGG